jgi:hypothetical protein
MAAAFMAITGALGGGGAAAGAATAASGMFAGGSAAGVAASTAAAGGGFASTLTTVLSIGSALASIAQGSAQAAALKDQATQVAVQDSQSRAKDAQERASLAEEYADLTSEQAAVQLANGLNPGVGTPASIREASTKFAERNLSVSRENTKNRSTVARLQQRSLMKQASNARLGGFLGAIGSFGRLYQAVG